MTGTGIGTLPHDRQPAGRPSGRAARGGWLLRNGAALLVLPAVALIGIGVLWPLGLSVWNSFTRVESGQNGYQWLLGNSVYLDIVVRTFAMAFIVAASCLLLGYPYAYLMTVVGARIRALLMVAAVLPFWISGLVRTFAWVILLEPQGPVPTLFPFPGSDQLLRTPVAVAIGLVQVLLPFMILPVYSVMRGIDQNLMVAAESLGARRGVAFARIFVPLSMPGVFAGAAVVFIMTLGFYVLPQMLGSPTQAMIGEAIYTQASKLGNVGRAGALATILLVGALLIVGVFAWSRRFLPVDRSR